MIFSTSTSSNCLPTCVGSFSPAKTSKNALLILIVPVPCACASRILILLWLPVFVSCFCHVPLLPSCSTSSVMFTSAAGYSFQWSSSCFSVEINSASGIFFTTSPFFIRRPSPIPPAIPKSASFASPGPFTTQPITATLISSG